MEDGEAAAGSTAAMRDADAGRPRGARVHLPWLPGGRATRKYRRERARDG